MSIKTELTFFGVMTCMTAELHVETSDQSALQIVLRGDAYQLVTSLVADRLTIEHWVRGNLSEWEIVRSLTCNAACFLSPCSDSADDQGAICDGHAHRD